MPDELKVKWSIKLSSEGIGGIAANKEIVVVGSRNILDSIDVFSCHDFATGIELWKVRFPAPGDLDYGNSPRATPLILKDRVICLGAFGHLCAVSISTGEVLWQKNLTLDFLAKRPDWGFCGSPLAVPLRVNGNDKTAIVFQPGSEIKSLVALDALDGSELWSVAGDTASYSSFVLAEIRGTSQLIGFEEDSIGGWNLHGKKLWTLKPEVEGDFNVPTPIVMDDSLFLSSENNGTRVHHFDTSGVIIQKPVAEFAQLNPDTHTPVRVGKMLCGTSDGLFCLDSKTLKVVHESDDAAFEQYTSMISDGKSRVLAITLEGEMILTSITQDHLKIVSRKRLTEEHDLMSHPAMVDGDLIIRVGRYLKRIPLISSR